MKKSTLATLTLLCIISHSLVAQIEVSNNSKKSGPLLNHMEIISTNDNFVSIFIPDGINSKSVTEISKSFSNFKSNIENFESKLPDYEFYSIEYVEGIKLEISEVIGKEIYQLNNGDDDNSIKNSNTFTLLAGKNKLVILFSELDELLDPQLATDISDAMNSLLDNKNKIIRGVIPSQEVYKYDAKKQSLNAVKDDYFEISIIPEFEFNATYVQNQFYYNPSFSVYLATNKLPNIYIGFSIDALLTYSSELNKQQNTRFIGPGIAFKHSAKSFTQLEYQWKTRDEYDLLSNTNTKLSISRRIKNFNFGIDIYDVFKSDNNFAISAGFSF
jgi:hypothetical protein